MFLQELATVIASEAKQSIEPRKERMDCFASLAMMKQVERECSTNHSTAAPTGGPPGGRCRNVIDA